jgi:hypothetical protein
MADRDLTKVVAANDYAGTGRTVSAQSIATVQGVASYATGGFSVDWTDLSLTADKVQAVLCIPMGTSTTDPTSVDRAARYLETTDKVQIVVASTGAELAATTDDSANYYKLYIQHTE